MYLAFSNFIKHLVVAIAVLILPGCSGDGEPSPSGELGLASLFWRCDPVPGDECEHEFDEVTEADPEADPHGEFRTLPEYFAVGSTFRVIAGPSPSEPDHYAVTPTSAAWLSEVDDPSMDSRFEANKPGLVGLVAEEARVVDYTMVSLFEVEWIEARAELTGLTDMTTVACATTDSDPALELVPTRRYVVHARPHARSASSSTRRLHGHLTYTWEASPPEALRVTPRGGNQAELELLADVPEATLVVTAGGHQETIIVMACGVEAAPPGSEEMR